MEQTNIPPHVSKIGKNIHVWGYKKRSPTSDDKKVITPTNSSIQPRAFPLGHKSSKKKGSAASGWQRQAMQRAHSSHDIVGDTGIVTPGTSPLASGRKSAQLPMASKEETMHLWDEQLQLQQQLNKQNLQRNQLVRQHKGKQDKEQLQIDRLIPHLLPHASPDSVIKSPRETFQTSNFKTSSSPTGGGKKNTNKKTYSKNNKSPGSSQKTVKERKQRVQNWERILWKRQTKDDNYVPDTWLDSVNRRSNTYGQGYWNMVKHTAVLMQQLSIVTIFSAVYRLALTEDTERMQYAAPSISLSDLLVIDFFLIGSFYIFHFILSSQIKVPAGATHSFFMQPHRIALFLVILMAVSPVLHTLTKAYASDTIYMLAMILGSIHIFFYDFTYTLSDKREFKCTVSMNAALLTGMLLASRLSSNLHCFALMCFSLELFTLSPILRHMLREYSESFHLVFTALLVFGVSILLFCTHELFFSSLWLMASTILPFFAPYMFIHLQVYKSVLWGPWDLGSGVPLTTTNQQQNEPN